MRSFASTRWSARPMTVPSSTRRSTTSPASSTSAFAASATATLAEWRDSVRPVKYALRRLDEERVKVGGGPADGVVGHSSERRHGGDGDVPDTSVAHGTG